MCGRYSLTADAEELARRFEFASDWRDLVPRYNIAPTQQVLAVVGGDDRRAGLMRWGLIPHWAKERKSGRPLINARAETVAERPAFRAAFRRRRCLVLADGFYEWQQTGGGKRPMRIVLESGEPFAFAGLWSVWTDPEGRRIPSCAIITTEANELVRPIHERMPVILPADAEAFWLDAEVDDPGALGSLLTPYPIEEMDVYEVSSLVNSAANDGPEVIARLA
ncbi:MAG: SOS response-associated peptidase [Chloroflexi bacterium]|nr:SOS response-associated peptidase [Chloroflexota bacterium]